MNSHCADSRRLKIWVAGCSTGEEAYSLALLLHRLVPHLYNWDITILATDINRRALDKAEEGLYSKWSLRVIPEWLPESWLLWESSDQFRVRCDIAKMVKFSFQNLVEESWCFPGSAFQETDILFCRNVLIYFSRERAGTMIQKFHGILAEGGGCLPVRRKPPSFPLLFSCRDV